MASISTLPLELFDTVILLLSDHEILHAQRVCKAWRNCIQQYTTLRRRIWSSTPLVIDYTPPNDRNAIQINPFLRKIRCFDLVFPPTMYDNDSYKTDSYHMALRTIDHTPAQPYSLLVELLAHDRFNRNKARVKKLRERHKLWFPGSQANMQLVRPSIPITLVVNKSGKSYYSYLDAGATMADVLQMMRQVEEDIAWEGRFVRRAKELGMIGGSGYSISERQKDWRRR